MSEPYAREILRRNVAQVCQTIGWNSINSTPLEILTHVLDRYIQSLATQTSKYAEQFNRTEPNLNDLGLVFRDLNVHVPELADYVHGFPNVPPPLQVNRFPKPKESNLDFLKPGSHEVVSRPMHVYEHLPRIIPEKERGTPAVAGAVEIKQNEIDYAENSVSISYPCTSDSPEKQNDVFKRPQNPVTTPSSKRPRLRSEEEERTREFSSVTMNMSGLLSSAREGKMPEARAPEKHDKHRRSHTPGIAKDTGFDKSRNKLRGHKILSGKIMKKKRKDKNHTNKSKDGSPIKNSDSRDAGKSKLVQALKQLASLTPQGLELPSGQTMPAYASSSEPLRTIKQDPVDISPSVSTLVKDTIPVPKKISISKSHLLPTPTATATKTSGLLSSLKSETEMKKKKYSVDASVNNNQPNAVNVDLSKGIDLRELDAISIDDDSIGASPAFHLLSTVPCVHSSNSQSLQKYHTKDLDSEFSKIKKDKKHRCKKNKAAKIEAKLIKRQQKQLAEAMAQTDGADQNDCKKAKIPKQSRSKKEKSRLSPELPLFSCVPGLVIPIDDARTELKPELCIRYCASTVQSPLEPVAQFSLMIPTASASEVQGNIIIENPKKKKDKLHKKEKKDKDGLNIKNKKDKKDKHKEKSTKRHGEDELAIAKKVRKEKKAKKNEKEKEKTQEEIVPKLTLKLASSISNLTMPPSPPDVYPVVKKKKKHHSRKTSK